MKCNANPAASAAPFKAFRVRFVGPDGEPHDADSLYVDIPPSPGALPDLTEPSGSRLAFEPIALKRRSDGWTGEKQRAFIDALADCGIVREAAARVGMSEQSARRLRRRADAAAFNNAWDAALQLGADWLRSVAYERAVEGVVKPRFYHGEQVGEERVYDNRLLMALLARAEKIPQADERRARSDCRRSIWQDDEGRWWTDFRAPLGFAGEQSGAYGNADYRRVCTAEEREAIDAMQVRKEAEEHRRREEFFAGMISPG